MKKTLKKMIPPRFISWYHLACAWIGTLFYFFPSEKLIVIGVTGTSGKSSTIFFLRQILEQLNRRVCALSTIEFVLPSGSMLNNRKMTMLGRFFIQKFLRQAVAETCEFAMVETTSEGVAQHRHVGINYDVAVLTNLYPEHIEAHGSFEKYKAEKLKFFHAVATGKRKKLGRVRKKVGIVNGAAPYADEFLAHPFDETVVFARNNEELFVEKARIDGIELILGKDVTQDERGLHFMIEGRQVDIKLWGEHNISNLLSAIAVCRALGISLEELAPVLALVRPAPGRIEYIPEAARKGFTVVVDYAFEPVAMKALYDTVAMMRPKRIIHVFGGTGGGRDVARRFTVGEFVGAHADICIVTDEDPYDDDPMSIITDVAGAVKKTGKIEGETLHLVLDREKAIAKAIAMAAPGDLVLITGKGSEQGMMVKEGLIPWDDRDIVRDALLM